MTAPRSTESRIKWFLNNSPGGSGMCARHSWRSLGGDYGNPPAWGCADANEVYDKVVKSGRYWTTTPPRGALVVWKYGNHGHAAISYGDGKIATTDPTNNPGGTGVEPLSYPQKWGATSSKRIWTDQYNGVRFDVASSSGGGGSISHGKVYLSKLKYGQKDSDSVKRLQHALNPHHLEGGQTLPVTGNYLEQTDQEVRLCQKQHGFGNDDKYKSFVGPDQAKHLFKCGCTIVNDL
jgi:hypothetical protein